jgi:hypothetical protein
MKLQSHGIRKGEMDVFLGGVDIIPTYSTDNIGRNSGTFIA